MATSNKTKTLRELQKELKKTKYTDKKIVFVHGVFDILHHGHIELFRRARNLGHILVVGVEHNYNSKIIKGPSRSINKVLIRAFCVSSVEFVDFVLLIPSFHRENNISEFYTRLYTKLKFEIIATSIQAGKHGKLKEKQAKKAGLKFKDIKHKYTKISTSKMAKLLKIE